MMGFGATPAVAVAVPTWRIGADGTLTADGTVQTINDKISTVPFRGQLLLDMSNMRSGDYVEVVESLKVLKGGSLGTVTKTQFSDVQEEPIMVFLAKVATYAHKITLRQIYGDYRNFDWSYQVEEV